MCRVHVSSGKCGECTQLGQRCDVRVTCSEFTRLISEKEKLQSRIKETQQAQNNALKASEKALEDLRVARARKEQLRQQMDLLDQRAEEAISVEERDLAEQEALVGTVSLEGPSDSLDLALLPST